MLFGDRDSQGAGCTRDLTYETQWTPHFCAASAPLLCRSRLKRPVVLVVQQHFLFETRTVLDHIGETGETVGEFSVGA
jgi:hypothetical protein